MPPVSFLFPFRLITLKPLLLISRGVITTDAAPVTGVEMVVEELEFEKSFVRSIVRLIFFSYF
jgi:hypothetical protein